MSVVLKEYRALLPLSASEYHLGQRYMVQKMCRIQSEGEGHGVEVIKNEVFTDHPEGLLQHSKKVIHIGKHLPAWFKKLSSQGFQILEESWNRYPNTHSEYRHPYIKAFLLDVDNKFIDKDMGQQDNVFQLNAEQLAMRTVEYVDFINDPVDSSITEVKPEEGNPRTYQSKRTGRGPLETGWKQELRQSIREDPLNTTYMSVYKLCRIEISVPYVAQMALEYIADTLIRPTIIRGTRALWCWQDEWLPLSRDEMYQLEIETAEILRQRLPANLRYSDPSESASAKSDSAFAS